MDGQIDRRTGIGVKAGDLIAVLMVCDIVV